MTDDELLASAFRKMLSSDEWVEYSGPGERPEFAIDGRWSASDGITEDEVEAIRRTVLAEHVTEAAASVREAIADVGEADERPVLVFDAPLMRHYFERLRHLGESGFDGVEPANPPSVADRRVVGALREKSAPGRPEASD